MIPHSKLRSAIDGCYEHILELIKTSKFLFDNSKYDSAIFYAIIVLEETSKLSIYCEHMRKGIDVSDTLENKMRKEHPFKLNRLMNQEQKMKEIAQEKYKIELFENKINVENLLKNNTRLNQIKQMALYFDHKKGVNIGMRHHFLKHKITKNMLANFCKVLINLAVYCVESEILRHKYGDTDGILLRENIPKNDESYKNMQKIYQDILSKESLEIFQSTFGELRCLYDYIYKND